MELNTTSLIARELMDRHGLNAWSFVFDNAVKRFGLTTYKTKTISMSKHLTRLNNEEAVRDTILHEIAHALVGPSVGHRYQWRATAISIGCNGKRNYSYTTATPEMNYRATCPAGHEHKRVKRPTGGTYLCRSTRAILTWEKV